MGASRKQKEIEERSSNWENKCHENEQIRSSESSWINGGIQLTT